ISWTGVVSETEITFTVIMSFACMGISLLPFPARQFGATQTAPISGRHTICLSLAPSLPFRCSLDMADMRPYFDTIRNIERRGFGHETETGDRCTRRSRPGNPARSVPASGDGRPGRIGCGGHR